MDKRMDYDDYDDLNIICREEPLHHQQTMEQIIAEIYLK